MFFLQSIFAERLQQLRLSKGLNAPQMAKQLGVSRQAIERLEGQQVKPSIETFCQLADFFNVSLDYLAGRSDKP